MNALATVAEVARPVFTPGVFDNMSAPDYFAIEAMSSSGAKKMIRSPLHYKLMRDYPTTPTATMDFGTAVHCGVLEPDTFADRVLCLPEFNKRTTAGKEAFAAFEAANADKILLTPDEYTRALFCIDAVRAHPAARTLLEGSRREVSAFWYDGETGVPCKARFDALNHGGIVDLKTCQDASPDGFARQAASLLYHLQAAAYNSGHEHQLDASMQFFAFVCVESEAPHAVACYALPGDAIMAGAHLWDRALQRYARVLKTGRFEGYATTIQPLKLPRWALRLPVDE